MDSSAHYFTGALHLEKLHHLQYKGESGGGKGIFLSEPEPDTKIFNISSTHSV